MNNTSKTTERKDTSYFSHDSNASNDPKILQLRSVYKWDGYGKFWKLVETLREQNDYRISIEGKFAWAGIGELLGIPADEAKTFVNACIEDFQLFETDGAALWSNSLLRRMGRMEAKQQQAKEAAAARWKKRNADAPPTPPETDADAMPTHSGSKPTAPPPPAGKGKKKQPKEKAARPGSMDEVLAHFKAQGYTPPEVESEKFWNYYTANGWRVGRSPMKDWKAATANWNQRQKEYGTRGTNNNSGPGNSGTRQHPNNIRVGNSTKGKYDTETE